MCTAWHRTAMNFLGFNMTDLLIAVRQDCSAFIVLDEPRQCACGRMAAFVINRDGTSRCVECDAKYTNENLQGDKRWTP